VDDRPTRNWLDVVHAVQASAGRTVEFVFENGTDELRRQVAVPPAPSQEAKPPIPLGARIARVAGQNEVQRGAERVVLPHELAFSELLKQNVGKSVAVEYRFRGETHVSMLDVREGCTDPWLMRVDFEPTVATYPMVAVISRSNPLAATWLGMRKTVQYIRLAYIMLRRLAYERSLGVQNISGPVGIVKMGTQVAEAGIVNLLFFLGFLSINLAVLNFLPLPIVDGGHMVFLIIEKLKGSPISMKIQVVTQMVGFVLIISVFVAVTVMDLLK
jgi:RIP metalloprotease RseP